MCRPIHRRSPFVIPAVRPTGESPCPPVQILPGVLETQAFSPQGMELIGPITESVLWQVVAGTAGLRHPNAGRAYGRFFAASSRARSNIGSIFSAVSFRPPVGLSIIV